MLALRRFRLDPARRNTVAFIVIGSFAAIFLSGILWATSRKAEEPHP
jgi:hypothetical protein